MNQDKDKKLKKLFQELGQADERLAPPFVKDWGMALSQARKNKASRPRYVFQLAAATILLIVLTIVIVGIFFNEHNQAGEKPLTASSVLVTPRNEPPKAPQPEGESTVTQPEELNKSIKAEKPVTMGRRQHSPQHRPTSVALSQWHSPTDFLLKSANEQLLRTVPKLSELPKEIRLDTEE